MVDGEEQKLRRNPADYSENGKYTGDKKLKPAASAFPSMEVTNSEKTFMEYGLCHSTIIYDYVKSGVLKICLSYMSVAFEYN